MTAPESTPETSTPVPVPETAVPPGETPAARCPYCERPFATERRCALHVGEAHRDEWTDADRDAYEEAADDEAEELFVYHLKVVAAITLLWAAFVVAYMVVLGLRG